LDNNFLFFRLLNTQNWRLNNAFIEREREREKKK